MAIWDVKVALVMARNGELTATLDKLKSAAASARASEDTSVAVVSDYDAVRDWIASWLATDCRKSDRLPALTFVVGEMKPP